MDDDKILKASRNSFEKAIEREHDNRAAWLEDVRFAKMDEQWPALVKKQRELEGRPCLTINKLKQFIRQVVNDVRQNKPAICVHPADDKADPETAEIINGLIRNIWVTSDGDVATDTAAECAVAGGFGYFRINTAQSSDDTFDSDLVVERIVNPLTVYGDPDSEAADSSDWNKAWITTTMTKDEFEEKYKDAEPVDWDNSGYGSLKAPWRDGDNVLVCEYWTRKEVTKQIVPLSNGEIVSVDEYEANLDAFQSQGIDPVAEPRAVKSHKVTQYLMTGAEILETVEWPGKYIPIVPVYGDETFVDGERYLRSLIWSAKDTQRNFNYWRTAATELVALAPKAPFIGPKDAFKTDAKKWATANTVSHSYIEYDGATPPQRQAFSGVPAGALQEALNAADDMKAVIGIYDASLGARSNETSGAAIRARAAQGDIATFHFIDNLSRAIRHAGRILIDLIPKVYSTERIIRVLGEDMSPKAVKLQPGAQPQPEQQDEDGNDIQDVLRIFDITAGKYDLTVKAGPSYSTQREEARNELVEVIRSFPAAAPILGPMYLRQSDWPGADDAADKLEGKMPDQAKEQIGQMQEALDHAKQIIGDLQAKAGDNDIKQQELALKQAELALKEQELEVKRIEAQTDMIRAQHEFANPYPQATNPSEVAY